MKNNKNEQAPIISLKDVSKYYSTAGNLALGLHNVSLDLHRGEIVAVTGQSGSGKSTFLNVVTAVDTYEDGEIYYKGSTTSYFSKSDMEEYRKQNVGFIYQNYNLVESYTVLENVILPYILKGEDDKTAKAHALEIIDRVGLTPRIHHRATKLSGGEKQRTVIARAIASDSPILACDEPTGNLDSKTSKEIIDLIYEVSDDRLVLIVTHDFNEVSEIATRRIRFSDGELVEDVKITEKRDVNREFKKKGHERLVFKNALRLGFLNLIRTPKKTILSLIVFMLCALMVFSNYSALTTGYKKSYDMFSSLGNPDPERVLIYNDDYQAIDFQSIDDALDTDLYRNSFSMDKKVNNNDFIITPFLPSQGELNGRLPNNDKECVVLNSSIGALGLGIGGSSYEIGEKVKFSNSLVDEDDITTLTVVGTYSLDMTNTLIYAPNLYDTYNGLVLEQYSKVKFLNANSNEETSITYDDSIEEGKYKVTYDSNNYTIDDVKKFTPTISIVGYTVPIDQENIIYEANSGSKNFELISTSSTVVNEINKYTFQIDTIPSGRTSLSDIKRNLNDMDVEVKSPSDFSNFNLSGIIDTLQNFVLIVNLILLLLVVYFISYFVLTKIYRTKNKDYTMIRSLGASKKDMSHIVRIETVILSSFGSLLIIILGLILAYSTTISYFTTFKSLDIYTFFIFIILMGLFGMLMAGRFNQKLFKYTVYDNLKKGELE